ncbi:MAG: hypothetical protein AB7D05_01885 [Mangrovibacterium sp.]
MKFICETNAVSAPDLKLSASYNHYFDQNADWSGREEGLHRNNYEVAFGMEYRLTEKTAVSLGVMHSETGAGQGYQTDMAYTLSSNTVGFGMQFRVSERFDMDLGGLFSMYENGYKEVSYGETGSYKELYRKTNLDFAMGLTYHLFR